MRKTTNTGPVRLLYNKCPDRIFISLDIPIPRGSNVLHTLLPEKNNARELFLHSDSGKNSVCKPNISCYEMLM